MDFINQYLKEAKNIIDLFDQNHIKEIIDLIKGVRAKNGRLFILGVGGGAGHASHAVNDFRKICGIEAYAPTDNVSELTARVNDDGWETAYVNWLKISKLNKDDMLLVFSVGGGNKGGNESANLVYALVYAKEHKAKIIGIVGRDGGYTAQVADAFCLIPVVNPVNTTPHTEAFHALVWHALVSHPKLKISDTKWESVR